MYKNSKNYMGVCKIGEKAEKTENRKKGGK